MESGPTMFLHGVIIALFFYIVMLFIFKQNKKVSENRALLIMSVALIYMILFGHGFPTKMNKL